MNPERWNQVDRLLQSALDRPSTERDAFLREACAGDEQLERELRSLVDAHDEAHGFLHDPAIDVAARHLADEPSRREDRREAILSSATRSPTTASSRNWAAAAWGSSTRPRNGLQRFVALKFVSPDLAGDADAVTRFGREARAAFSAQPLQHLHCPRHRRAGRPRTGMRKRRPSFGRSSTILASSAWIPSALWRTCNSAERSRHSATTPTPSCLPGFPDTVGAGRFRRPRPAACQGGIRPAASQAAER